jgi:hypothetical protein
MRGLACAKPFLSFFLRNVSKVIELFIKKPILEGKDGRIGGDLLFEVLGSTQSVRKAEGKHYERRNKQT